MEEIKFGEFVRTIDGYIRKVTQVNEKGSYECLCWGAYLVDEKYKNSVGISAKKIAKHSFNIIDLIEVGDYVNGCLIVEINKDPFITNQTNLWTNMLLSYGEPFSNEYYKLKILEKDIKSIVTREQFENIEYKVGE